MDRLSFSVPEKFFHEVTAVLVAELLAEVLDGPLDDERGIGGHALPLE